MFFNHPLKKNFQFHQNIFFVQNVFNPELAHIKTETSIFQTKTIFQKSLLEDEHKNFLEDISYKIQDNKNMTIVLKEMTEEFSKTKVNQPKSISQQILTVAPKTYNQAASRYLKHDAIYPNFPSNLISNGNLLYPVVFHIGFEHFFGLINHARIGQDLKFSIPPDEISTSLLFLRHLINSIANLLKIVIPPVVTFLPVDLKRKANVDSFNQNIQKFFISCDTLFSTIMHKYPHLTPPSLVDLKKKQIANQNYFFERDNPLSWTRAMKLLLVDFKFIQFNLLQEKIHKQEELFAQK